MQILQIQEFMHALQRVVAEQVSKFMCSFMVILTCTNQIARKYYSQANVRFHCISGERPEAMQTGTSTYIANNIMQTILISIIISTYNIFQNYYTSILHSCRLPDEITWHTSSIVPTILSHTSSFLRGPYERRTHHRW